MKVNSPLAGMTILILIPGTLLKRLRSVKLNIQVYFLLLITKAINSQRFFNLAGYLNLHAQAKLQPQIYECLTNFTLLSFRELYKKIVSSGGGGRP